ncbi:MAG: exported protease [Amycolatopsis sp.]|uniref:alpha/beta hydrolase n=1 Tax=Amycolatopsis sp. TaxID=37632 RepID=UPI002601E59D|nr:alpha/beta hydrolase [Amycolatopsis sp.]MCU1682983.1 exported protease [Amycolatopsis sp.]
MTFPRRTAVFLSVCLLSAFTAACSPEPAAVPPSRPLPLPPPAAVVPAKFTAQTLAWGDCTSYSATDSTKRAFQDTKFDCARLSVPLDYAKPDGDTITVAVVRHRATQPGHRVGSLVLDPGGPGASGIDAAVSNVEDNPSSAPVQRFDLVGFDPRGVGASTPRITCLTGAERDADRAGDAASDVSPAGLGRQQADAKAYTEKCVQRTPHGLDMLANVGTRDVARDLDILRGALGEQKLTYLGYSYGTEIGSRYAEEFPGKVRAMVLDGAIDPQQGEVDSLVSQSAGFQHAFDQFAQWCVPRSGCPLGRTIGGATQTFQRLVQPLIARKLTVDGRKLSFSDAITGTTAALYSQRAWNTLTAALTAVKHGDGGLLLDLADSYYERDDSGAYSNLIDVYSAVRCVDNERVSDRATIETAHQQMHQLAPMLDGGTPDMSELDICAMWPVPPTSEAHLPKADGLPPTLVISTTNDPATPYQAGVNLAKDLHGRLLTFEGTQHTAYLEGNACVDQAASDYLTAGTLPPDGTRCK